MGQTEQSTQYVCFLAEFKPYYETAVREPRYALP